MITCKVGESIITCFDVNYGKHKLKEWSTKGILRCPACGREYEYCHGDIINPYFRHKEKCDCESMYGESETDEHIKGKIAIYEWLLSIAEDEELKNINLEYYIRETRQRPDIYFEKGNDKFVIEFQCSPISTEQIKRSELYKLAGINDIWILGLKNYNMSKKGNYIGTRMKHIEKVCDMYFDVDSSNLIFNYYKINKFINGNNINGYEFDSMNNFTVKKNGLCLKDEKMYDIHKKYDKTNTKRVIDEYNEWNALESMKKEVRKYYREFGANNISKVPRLDIDFKSSKHVAYDFYVKFYTVSSGCVYFLIKKTNTIASIRYSQKAKCEYDMYNTSTITGFIDSFMKPYIEKDICNKIIKDETKRREIEEFNIFKLENKDVLTKDIELLDGNNKYSNDVRFKYLKEFTCSEEYIKEFIKQARFMIKKSYDLRFMIPKDIIKQNYDKKIIIDMFKKYAFESIEFKEA